MCSKNIYFASFAIALLIATSNAQVSEDEYEIDLEGDSEFPLDVKTNSTIVETTDATLSTQPPTITPSQNNRRQSPTFSPIVDPVDPNLDPDYEDPFAPTNFKPSISTRTGSEDPFAYKQLISQMFQSVTDLAKAEKKLRKRDDLLFNLLKQLENRVNNIVSVNLRNLENKDNLLMEKIGHLEYNLVANFTTTNKRIDDEKKEVEKFKDSTAKNEDDLWARIKSNRLRGDNKLKELNERHENLREQTQNLVKKLYNLNNELQKINAGIV